MSGYFDGLMRSSGLPLGDAPVLGRAPRRTASLEEIDVATPVATPLVGPLELAGSTVGPPTTEPSTPSTTIPIPLLAADPVAPPANLPRPAASPPSREVSAPTALPNEPAVTHQRIIQAAMRWIADGSAQPQHASDATRAMTESALRVERTADDPSPAAISPAFPTTMLSDEGEPPVNGTVERQQSEPVPTAPQAAAEILPAAVASQASRAVSRTGLPVHDDVHVSIGAIHLRVEAPAPAALQAAVAAAPRPAAKPPASPRTGLSRRALRRI